MAVTPLLLDFAACASRRISSGYPTCSPPQPIHRRSQRLVIHTLRGGGMPRPLQVVVVARLVQRVVVAMLLATKLPHTLTTPLYAHAAAFTLY